MFAYDDDALAAIDRDDIDSDALAAFIREIAGAGYFTDLESAVASFDEAYIGDMSLRDYVYDYVEDCLGLTGVARDYFDYDRFGRDLVMGGDVSETSGYLFYGSW